MTNKKQFTLLLPEGDIAMKKDMENNKQELEEYPKSWIISGNLMMILWIALGTIACWLFYPIIGLVYLAFAIKMIYVVLRRLVCTNCYYYDKWCSMGWGKLSAVFFKKGNTEDFKTSTGIKLAPLTYGLLSIIPVILIIVSTIHKFSISRIVVLILLLLISFYSGTISRKKACRECKMRLMCPGSAVK